MILIVILRICLLLLMVVVTGRGEDVICGKHLDISAVVF